MVVVETQVFTRVAARLLADEDLRQLQIALVLRPGQGTLIKGAHGLRKLRWGRSGRGKRGDLRVFYFWDAPASCLYLLYAIEKSRQADLTRDQLRELGRIVREELR
ncbi:MAG TPA: type II toxin-antitoxin system RelE/ParE family toxin [Actinomycetota bacterium]